MCNYTLFTRGRNKYIQKNNIIQKKEKKRKKLANTFKFQSTVPTNHDKAVQLIFVLK